MSNEDMNFIENLSKMNFEHLFNITEKEFNKLKESK